MSNNNQNKKIKKNPWSPFPDIDWGDLKQKPHSTSGTPECSCGTPMQRELRNLDTEIHMVDFKPQIVSLLGQSVKEEYICKSCSVRVRKLIFCGTTKDPKEKITNLQSSETANVVNEAATLLKE